MADLCYKENVSLILKSSMTTASAFINSRFFQINCQNMKILMNQSYSNKEKSGPLLVGKQLIQKMEVSTQNVVMLTSDI